MNETMMAKTLLPGRPWAHFWAAMMFGLLLPLCVAMLGQGGASPVVIVLGLLSLEAAVGVRYWKRSRVHYWCGAGALWMAAVLWVWFMRVCWHNDFAEGAVMMRTDWLELAAGTVLVALFAWLACAFTFGSASRRFYGLG